MPPIELWRHAFAFCGEVAPLARRSEHFGYDGVMVADSQNLNADVWVELALAAASSERILLGPGVTNPATRDPAVTASAAATLQAESGGRAVLGIGRGDSALTQLGREPVDVGELERALAAVQGYLSGEEVERDGKPTRIGWIADSGQPKVPVAVAATGPHVIAAAARHAERVDFTVGAERERLRWAIETARAAAGGRALSLGAFLNVAVDHDRAAARDLVRGSTAIFARFATEGAPSDGLSEVTRAGIAQLRTGYDEARHGHADAPHARALEDEFIDRFAVVGDIPSVAERLREITALGIERIIVVPGSLDADPALNERTAELVVRDVRPLVQAESSATAETEPATQLSRFAIPDWGSRARMATPDAPRSSPKPAPGADGSRREGRTMIPGRERRRLKAESVLMRVVATGGIVAIGVLLGAILVSQDVAGWIVGLVVALASVILSAILWSARQL